MLVCLHVPAAAVAPLLLAGLLEDSTLAPANPYSAAKAGAELMALAYRASYKLPIIMTRSANVYGPRQFPEKLIPKLILLASRGERLPVHGDGRARRAYLYVDDVAEAFDLILHKGGQGMESMPVYISWVAEDLVCFPDSKQGEVGDIYNIGSQATRSVLDVASDICCAVQCQGHVQIDYVRDRAFNDTRQAVGMWSFICDPKLAALGWQERTAWEAGLRQTISWYDRFVGRDGGGYWDKAHVAAALEPHPHPAPFASA
ncbi:Trifunctional UDP-glucose 4 [Chlorella vulgaris]